MGSNEEELVGEVLEALSPEIVVMAVVYNKYWIEAWRDHIASCTTEDLVTANIACIAQALSTSV